MNRKRIIVFKYLIVYRCIPFLLFTQLAEGVADVWGVITKQSASQSGRTTWTYITIFFLHYPTYTLWFAKVLNQSSSILLISYGSFRSPPCYPVRTNI